MNANRFLLGDPDYIAKGYKPILTMNEGYADVAYEETPELIEAQNVLRSTNVSTWSISLQPWKRRV